MARRHSSSNCTWTSQMLTGAAFELAESGGSVSARWLAVRLFMCAGDGCQFITGSPSYLPMPQMSQTAATVLAKVWP